MLNDLKTRNISLKGYSAEAKRAEILRYFLKTFEVYDRLFDILTDDSAFYKRPEPLRHPIIFYFGHTAAFYINKLVLAKKMLRINPAFESMFAIGVDEMSWDDLDGAKYDWPSVDAVREYRQKVRDAVCEFIKKEPITIPIDWDSGFWAILMGCEHERIHLETSSVLIRQLDVSDVVESTMFTICETSSKAPSNTLLKVKGGGVKLGKKFDDDFYGWDNEYGSFEMELSDFEASKYLVSNGEFLELIS